MPLTDWVSWHDLYADPASPWRRRLDSVRDLIRQSLAMTGQWPPRIISMCAGQGRDILPVLAEHPRGREVPGRLIEADPRNASIAASTVSHAGLHNIDVTTGDAGLAKSYAGAVPADLILACGVLGHLDDADIQRLAAYMPQLCRPNAIFLWTRLLEPHHPTNNIREHLSSCCDELTFTTTGPEVFGIGAHQFTGQSQPLDPSGRIFTFGSGD
jgi:hypothetical protein